MKTREIPRDRVEAAEYKTMNDRMAVALLRRALRRAVKHLKDIHCGMGRVSIIDECQTALDDTQPAKLAGRK